MLAHERGFASWVRTGMVAVGIGLSSNALFLTMEPSWMPKAIATSFLLVAINIFVSAERRARNNIGRLESHNVAVLKPMRIRLLAWAQPRRSPLRSGLTLGNERRPRLQTTAILPARARWLRS